VYITTNPPDTNSNYNTIPNPTAKRHAVESIQLNIVISPMYREKLTRDNVIAPCLLISVVNVTLSRVVVINGIGHVNKVKLRRSRLVLGLQ